MRHIVLILILSYTLSFPTSAHSQSPAAEISFLNTHAASLHIKSISHHWCRLPLDTTEAYMWGKETSVFDSAGLLRSRSTADRWASRYGLEGLISFDSLAESFFYDSVGQFTMRFFDGIVGHDTSRFLETYRYNQRGDCIQHSRQFSTLFGNDEDTKFLLDDSGNIVEKDEHGESVKLTQSIYFYTDGRLSASYQYHVPTSDFIYETKNVQDRDEFSKTSYTYRGDSVHIKTFSNDFMAHKLIFDSIHISQNHRISEGINLINHTRTLYKYDDSGRIVSKKTLHKNLSMLNTEDTFSYTKNGNIETILHFKDGIPFNAEVFSYSY